MNTEEITTFTLSGLSCQSCQKLVTKLLMKLDGVREVVVDLQTGKTMIMANRTIPALEAEHVLENTAYHIER